MELSCREKYRKIINTLVKKDISITVMESCTGGIIASLLTDTEGASGVFKGSFVTYSNEAKIRAGVPHDVIERYGVYSPECARAMAQACSSSFGARIGIGVTGSFSNPDPDNGDSVPGEVFFSIYIADGSRGREQEYIEGKLTGVCGSSRKEIKLFVAERIADVLLEMIDG